MRQIKKTLFLALAVIGVSLAAGCADQASSPPVAAATGPELAGAWYQVYFDTSSIEVNARGKMIAKNVAFVIANNGTARVTVIGKADRVGSQTANAALSQRRAGAVREALIAAGVPATRIDTSWTGENNQEVATANDVAEQRNRVVDVTVVKQSG